MCPSTFHRQMVTSNFSPLGWFVRSSARQRQISTPSVRALSICVLGSRSTIRLTPAAEARRSARLPSPAPISSRDWLSRGIRARISLSTPARYSLRLSAIFA
jgi:hypothetical protein